MNTKNGRTVTTHCTRLRMTVHRRGKTRSHQISQLRRQRARYSFQHVAKLIKSLWVGRIRTHDYLQPFPFPKLFDSLNKIYSKRELMYDAKVPKFPKRRSQNPLWKRAQYWRHLKKEAVANRKWVFTVWQRAEYLDCWSSVPCAVWQISCHSFDAGSCHLC